MAHQLELTVKTTANTDALTKFAGGIKAMSDQTLKSNIAIEAASQKFDRLSASAERTGTAMSALKAEQARRQLEALQNGADSASKGMTGLSAAAVALGVATERLAEQFIHVGSSLATMVIGLQDATDNLQNMAATSDKATEQIAAGLLDMSATSIYSAKQLTDALAGSAGRLESLTGQTLTAADAQRIMASATDLATASQQDLKSTTAALTSVMLNFQIPLSQVAETTDTLFNITRITGLGIDEFATSAGRLRDKIGTSAPPLAEMGALVAELGAQGLTGSRGLMTMTGAIENLTGGSDGVNKALHDMGAGVFDAQGKFIGMRNVISELQPIFAKMSDAERNQAASALFGAGAAGVMINLIAGGVATFDSYTARIDENGTATAAAARHYDDLGDKLQILKNNVGAVAIGFAQQFEPAMSKAVETLSGLVSAIEKNDAAMTILGAISFGAVIGGLALVAAAFYAVAGAATVAFVAENAALLGIPIAIAAAVAGLYLLVKNWDAVWQAMQAAPGFLLDHVGEILRDIALFFAPGGIVALIAIYWKDIFAHMPEPVQVAMNTVAGIVQTVVSFTINMVAGLIDAFAKVVEGARALAEAMSYLPGPLGAPWTAAVKGIDSVIDKFHEAASAARDFANNLDFTITIRTQTIAGTSLAQIQSEEDKLRAIRGQGPVASPVSVPGPAVVPPLPTTGGGGKSPAIAEANQNLIDLAAAFDAFNKATGGTVADFLVYLKVTQDRIDLDKQVADATTNLNASMIEHADKAFQLKEVYVELATQAAKTGETIQQAMAEMFAGMVDKAQSAINNILNTPTREGTELQLKLDRLQLQRDSMSPNDPRAKALDAEIASIQRLIKVRQDSLAILRDQAILANKMLQTDAQQLNAVTWLNNAMLDLTQTVAGLNGRLQMVTGASGGSAVPQAASGGYVAQSGLAVIHRGEWVTPASKQAAPTTNLTFNSYITADSNASDESMRKLAKMVREEAEAALRKAAFRGSYVTSGAYTPS